MQLSELLSEQNQEHKGPVVKCAWNLGVTTNEQRGPGSKQGKEGSQSGTLPPGRGGGPRSGLCILF